MGFFMLDWFDLISLFRYNIFDNKVGDRPPRCDGASFHVVNHAQEIELSM